MKPRKHLFQKTKKDLTIKNNLIQDPKKTLDNNKEVSLPINKSKKLLKEIPSIKTNHHPELTNAQSNTTKKETQNSPSLLHLAARKNELNLLKNLLSQQEPDQKDEDENTPLHLATQNGHHNAVNLLLEHKANPSLVNKQGLSPLHIAVIKGRERIVANLLASGANLNQRTQEGSTALHISAYYGYLQITQMLVEAGADIDISVADTTPLACAEVNKKEAVIQYLKSIYSARQRLPFPPLGQAWILDRLGAFGYKNPGVCAGISCLSAEMLINGKFDAFKRKLQEIYSVGKNALFDLCSRNTEVGIFVQKLLLYQKASKDNVVFFGNVENTTEFITTGAYMQQELELFFSKLEEYLVSENFCTFITGNLCHVITIHWDLHSKKWIIIDANNLPWCQKTIDTRELASKVKEAFSFKGDINSALHNVKIQNRLKDVEAESPFVMLSTWVCIPQSDPSLLTKAIQQLKSDHSWRKMHEVSLEKIQARDNIKTPWWHLAIREGQEPELVKTILSYKTDPNKENHFWKVPPLSMAVSKDHLEMVKILLQHGANPNQKAKNYPLIIRASKNNNTEIAQALLEHGADPNCTAPELAPALCLAAKNKNFKLVNILLQYKANPNISDPYGLTPLHHAVKQQNLEIVQTLLLNGAKPNARDKNGETPLLQAVQEGDFEIIKVLLEYQADPNQQNYEGNSALFPAIMQAKIDIIQLLLLYQADLKLRNKEGKTPAQIALEEGLIEIADMLKT